MINNRNYWTGTQIDSNAAIWIFRYAGSKEWDWVIGLEKRLGTDSGAIFSSHEATRPSACPTSANQFGYGYNTGIQDEQRNAPANSVFIQCV